MCSSYEFEYISGYVLRLLLSDAPQFLVMMDFKLLQIAVPLKS